MAKKIVIVEDDEFLRSLTSKRLESEGYEVAVAVDGEDAVKVIPKENPDLIFLDLLLPNKNGFEVLEEIRKDDKTKDTPVVVFSNLGQKEDIEKVKKFGVTEFLVKANFTLDDVVVKLKEILK